MAYLSNAVAGKSWKSAVLSAGDTWTVPADASLVTVTACAAGGPSGSSSVSVGVPPSALSCVMQGAALVFQYNHNYGLQAVDISGNAAHAGSEAVVWSTYNSNSVATLTKFQGQMYVVFGGNDSGYYSQIFSSPDYGRTNNNLTNGSLNLGTTGCVDLLADPTGAKPGIVWLRNSAAANSWAYVPNALAVGQGKTISPAGALTTVKGGRFLNGNFIAFGNDTNTHPEISYSTSGDNGTWTAVQLNGSDTCYVADMAYSSTLGLYVAVCSAGKIYTATSLGGTWTSRTSGSANAFTGIVWANSRFVACGASGLIAYSTNGTSWSLGTGTNSDTFARYSLCYGSCNGTSTWVACNADVNGVVYRSTDGGATWTAGTAAYLSRIFFVPNGRGVGQDCFCGVYVGSAVYYSLDGSTWTAISSVNFATQTADTRILVNGVEQVRLQGGGLGKAVSNNSVCSFGGSYHGGKYFTFNTTGSTGVSGGSGPNGQGGQGTTATAYSNIPTGSAGRGYFNNSYPVSGGGGVQQYTNLARTNAINIFLPGASGGQCQGTNSYSPGGGGSIFSYGGDAQGSTQVEICRPYGRGSGGGYFSSMIFNAGGGGESCFRAVLTCVPGDQITAYLGIGSSATNNTTDGNFAGNGYALVEWQ